MAYIRSYREPIPNVNLQPVDTSRGPLPRSEWRDVFVILEEPLLELYQEDLAYLKAMRIDVFSE